MTKINRIQKKNENKKVVKSFLMNHRKENKHLISVKIFHTKKKKIMNFFFKFQRNFYH